MQLKLYSLLVVAARLIGLLLAGRALFMLLVAFTLEKGLTTPTVALMMTGPSIVAGIVLWLVAKPLARLLTRDAE